MPRRPSSLLWPPLRFAKAAKLLLSFNILFFLSACERQQAPFLDTWKLPGEEISLEFRSNGTLLHSTLSTSTEGTWRQDESGSLFLDMGKEQWKAAFFESNDELRVNDSQSNLYIFLREPVAALVDSAQVLFNRGYETRDCDSSITFYSQSISLLEGIPSETGHLARAYNNRGICEERGENIDAAFADYNKALSLDPELDIAYGNRAWLYEQTGEKEKAYADYKKAAELGYLPAKIWMEEYEKQTAKKLPIVNK